MIIRGVAMIISHHDDLSGSDGNGATRLGHRDRGRPGWQPRADGAALKLARQRALPRPSPGPAGAAAQGPGAAGHTGLRVGPSLALILELQVRPGPPRLYYYNLKLVGLFESVTM